MRHRRFVAAAAFVLSLAGCQANGLSLAAQPPAVARSQQPDPNPSATAVRKTSLETTPSQFPDLPDRGNVMVRVRAQVNGVAILDQEVREGYVMSLLRLSPAERAAQANELFRHELQEIIDREVILQDAYSKLGKTGPQFLEKLKAAASREFDKKVRSMKAGSGSKTDEELKNFLRTQGLSLAGMERRFERDFIAREYMRSRVYPAVDRIGHEQIVEYYEEHPSEFQTVDSVRWQDIFIDASKYGSRDEARRLAETVAARARAGEDFAKLAQYDNGDSSYRNGEGFGRRHGEIKPPEAEALLFRLHDGEIGPVVELSTGFHVVRLVKRDYAGKMPLDDKTQAEIRKRLQNQVGEREIKRLVAELKLKASIQIVDANP
jgi:parvulin-like peptidyl-prolyl isomerase